MSTEANKRTLARYLQEVLNEGYLDRLDELMDYDYLDHDLMPGQPAGLPGVIQALALLRIAFPDMEAVWEEMVAEGDRVAVRYTMRGTHLGDFLGIAATGRQVSWSGMSIVRFVDGMMAEGWEIEDGLGLLRQLGALPA